jgi:hypothetical protein
MVVQCTMHACKSPPFMLADPAIATDVNYYSQYGGCSAPIGQVSCACHHAFHARSLIRRPAAAVAVTYSYAWSRPGRTLLHTHTHSLSLVETSWLKATSRL